MNSSLPEIDAVVTWVDGDDPAHRARLDAYLAGIGERPATAAPTRFRSVGEIEWCVVSLLRFAPYVRRIHVITDRQVPPVFERARHWPDAFRQRLNLVDHRTIFAGHEEVLPTFNSRSIETMMWRIPGLAEHFVYLNDDFLLLRPVPPDAFFVDGRPRLRGRWRVPQDREIGQRIKRVLRGWLGLHKPPRPLHQRSQALAGALLGFDRRYFGTHHVPQPLRRSTFERFFAEHPERLAGNIACRLRDLSQFGPMALANHCEIREGSAVIDADEARLYLEPATMTVEAVQRAFAVAEGDPAVLFACVQSLDEAPADVAQATIDGLDRIIGRNPPDAPPPR